MSECIICKGHATLSALGFSVVNACDFLMRGAFWLGGTSDIWTFKYMGKEIDTIITDAQCQMHNGMRYEDTQIYKLINCLIDNNISFAMWYDDYIEELEVCNTKDEVLKACYEQIMDKNGMCEVYIVLNTATNIKQISK